MHALTIAVLPGDGIGPEVVAQGTRVLRAVAETWGHEITLREGLIGGCAIEAHGAALPDETLRLCREADAVLLGAVGGPRWDDPAAPVRPEQGLLGLRQALGVYANFRPVVVHPRLAAVSPLRPERLHNVDFVVVRELTGGIYFGEKRRERLDGREERAVDECVYTTGEIERVVRVAAEVTQRRRGKLTSVDKANVLETSRLWRSTTTRVVRDEFPELELEHLLVDACAMHLLRRPVDFDVIVTENMFGDILTDEAAMLAGSLGVLPSASLGDGPSVNGVRRGLYEPIHGSAPDIAGRGIANPIGTILSVAMMLRHSFALEREARAVEAGVAAALDADCVSTDLALPGARCCSTEEIGQTIAETIVSNGTSATRFEVLS